jgi:polysaccharide export outer membrane protein
MLCFDPHPEGAMSPPKIAVRLSLAWFAGLVSLLIALVDCSGGGNYVWVNDLPRDPADAAPGDYVIATGDVLEVRVLGHEDLSNPKVRVREDGRIAMPILGEVNASGVRPSALRGEIEARLKDYVKEPSVSVNVEEAHGTSVSVLGEVSRPGSYPIEPGGGVAQALAIAGGVTEYADRDRIFVLRGGAHPIRVRFTYDALTRGERPASAFVLRAGDLVVVE